MWGPTLYIYIYTYISLPQTNSKNPENGWLEDEMSFWIHIYPSLKLTAKTLKMDGWKMKCPFGMAYSQGRTVCMDAFFCEIDKILRWHAWLHIFVSATCLLWSVAVKVAGKAWQCNTREFECCWMMCCCLLMVDWTWDEKKTRPHKWTLPEILVSSWWNPLDFGLWNDPLIIWFLWFLFTYIYIYIQYKLNSKGVCLHLIRLKGSG